MNDLIMLILAINLFASLIVFFMIMNDNNFHFIKWAKHSFEIRNWFGKIQICLLIVWMMPIIIICAVSFPVVWILANIFVDIIFGCNKIIELGKKQYKD